MSQTANSELAGASTQTTIRASTKGQAISLQQVSKYWGKEAAVDGVDLDVAPGTFTVLLGPSGCGKSTSLRIIAGLEAADSGNVLIGGNVVNQLPPARRDIAMVFQSYALFPHLTVAENILFGLKVRRTSKSEQHERLKKTAELLGLMPYLNRKPSQLSGGQQQRVALGRAIIAQKPVCLMDEPLSNLDAKLRNTMRTEIRDLQQALGFSMVYVTHDQAEAITMADQVVLMKKGRVEQSGTPRQIYETPATAFVAGFIGTPPMNLINARDLLSAVMPGTSSSSSVITSAESPKSSTDAFDELLVGVRPEHLQLSQVGEPGGGKGGGINAYVEHVEYLGSDLLVKCHVGQSTLLARVDGHSRVQAKARISLTWQAEHTHLFDRTTGARTLFVPELYSAVFSHQI